MNDKNINIDMLNFITEHYFVLPEDQQMEVFITVKPKIKCKNKYLQRILNRIFGFKPYYEVKKGKKLTIKAEDCPENWDGSLEINFTSKDDE